ncbi:hypothetical protein TNIN_287491 [Trichonephila inaurata madagascariensis]|uniref:Uncharacterized protein n=1 Tax=Trichonephila inaurata madagascariensis TaxID=2747483 RepID=A0A8X6XEJ9_9ARAC|nr:hypothetical protein TNIN_287491 [Trichonephila inaurata madagascariensis]
MTPYLLFHLPPSSCQTTTKLDETGREKNAFHLIKTITTPQKHARKFTKWRSGVQRSDFRVGATCHSGEIKKRSMSSTLTPSGLGSNACLEREEHLSTLKRTRLGEKNKEGRRQATINKVWVW